MRAPSTLMGVTTLLVVLLIACNPAPVTQNKQATESQPAEQVQEPESPPEEPVAEPAEEPAEEPTDTQADDAGWDGGDTEDMDMPDDDF